MTIHPSISATDAFSAEIHAKLGVALKESIADGKTLQFSPKKTGRDDNGWYFLHDDEFPAGAFGETSSLSEEERKRLQQVKIDRAKKQEAAIAAAAASALKRCWSNASLARDDRVEAALTPSRVDAGGRL